MRRRDRQIENSSRFIIAHVKRVRDLGQVRGVVGFNKNFKIARALPNIK
jgi:hypothetical protein